MNFTKRKFLKLEPRHQHKKCAELLRTFYETLHKKKPLASNALTYYNSLLSWMRLHPFTDLNLYALADRYHWHLREAGRSLKEHNLLPHIRQGDHIPKTDFLPIAIYLDQIRSAYNVGSILRTTEALRLGTLHFSEKTPNTTSDKVLHTAMGAAPLVPCFQNSSLSSLPRPFIALETSNDAIPLSSFLFPETFTLILGNEEYGISHEVLRKVDTLIEIPLLGVKNSINVACAFAIAAAEIRRQKELPYDHPRTSIDSQTKTSFPL